MRKLSQPLIINEGGVRVEIEYRRRGSDAGLSFQVYGADRNPNAELLRFDCFQKRPHFHYLENSRTRRIERIDKKKAPDPVRWTLERLKEDLSSVLWKAGHRKLAKEIDQPALAKALARAEKKILRLARG